MQRINLWAVALPIVLGACSSGISPDGAPEGGSEGGSDGGSGGCTMTFSGAVSLTVACTIAYPASYDVTNDKSAFSVASTAQSGTGPGSFAINVTGELAPATYDFSNGAATLLEGSLLGASGSNKSWTASLMDSEGAMSVQITSLVVQTQTSSGKTYVVHGTVDATMAPNTAATADGNVTAHVVF